MKYGHHWGLSSPTDRSLTNVDYDGKAFSQWSQCTAQSERKNLGNREGECRGEGFGLDEQSYNLPMVLVGSSWQRLGSQVATAGAAI